MDNSLIHRFVEVNGVRLHIAEQGHGPLVLLMHGWPESWYSWRHQFGPLATAGYRVVAPDQRGYARSEQPPDVGGLHAAPPRRRRDRPDRRARGGAGHPRRSRLGCSHSLDGGDAAARQGPCGGRAQHPADPAERHGPPSITRAQYGEGFYQIYFQRPGVADAEFARDIPDTFRRLLVGASGDNPDGREPRPLVIPEGRGLLDMMPVSPTLPAWLSEDDIRAYSEDFALHGDRAFTGAFNWYRNMELNNELLAPFRGRRVERLRCTSWATATWSPR